MKLYKLDLSPPSRACMMLCELLGLEVEMIDINIMGQENKTPEYLKLNPIHTIPVLEDEDLVIHDSHAILMYLADVYGKDDTLYPKNEKQRALVNQKLFLDASIIFPNGKRIIYSAVKEGQRKLTDKQKNEVTEAYDFLEAFLDRHNYIAGDVMTIADISAITSITTSNYIIPIDDKKYPKIVKWIKEMEKKPFYKGNVSGLQKSGAWLQSIMEL